MGKLDFAAVVQTTPVGTVAIHVLGSATIFQSSVLGLSSTLKDAIEG
jgi:hypothetical protein